MNGRRTRGGGQTFLNHPVCPQALREPKKNSFLRGWR
jgi:hypothetical protein